jgi:hypothetical protein
VAGRKINKTIGRLAVWMIVAGYAPTACPVTPVYFQTAGERVAVAGRLAPPGSGPALSVEVGEMQLFGSAGLRADGFRIRYAGERLGWFASGTNLSCSLGSEKTGALGGVVRAPGKVRAAWRVGGVLVSVPPYERAGLVTWSGSLAAELSSQVIAGCGIEDLRLTGEPYPGVDMKMWATVRPVRAATLTVSVRVSRWGELETGFAGRLVISRTAGAWVGYDEASGQIKTAVELTAGGVSVGLGAMFHPVLGVSKAINLGWGR